MMDHLKNPLAARLPQVIQQKANDANYARGQAYPCTVKTVMGAIVTVNFELNSGATLPNTTMPIAGNIYARAPIQPGCKGVAMSADTYLGGMSGLGGGVADTSQRANLSTLIFFPIGNTAWPEVDGDTYVITGVGSKGVLLRSGDLTVTFELSASGIAINLNGMNMTITNGDIIVDTTSFKTHEHSGVETGGGASGPPIPGT